ncbi:MAG: hypothetical protein MIO88_00940, partial [Methanoregulaceae archaeon]|nr:hypothetical protein [Methanoregulaceae archaeon]
SIVGCDLRLPDAVPFLSGNLGHFLYIISHPVMKKHFRQSGISDHVQTEASPYVVILGSLAKV